MHQSDTWPDLTSPALEHIAAAAHASTVALVNEDGDGERAASADLEAALHAAINERASLSDIAEAEQAGRRRARDELRREVLRGIERGAKHRRDGQGAYEAAVRRGGRLGLGSVEMSQAALVTHSAIRKLLARPKTTCAPLPPESEGDDQRENVEEHHA